MGQKVNPTIFRLGTKKSQWRSQFFGKSKEESALFFYQDFEIRKFLNRVFESNGTIITNCVIKRSNLKLDLFLHFYVTSRVQAKTLESFSKISTLKTFVQGKYLNATNFLSVNNIKNKLVKNFKNDSSEIIYITDIIKKKSNYSLFKQKLVDSLSKFTGVSKISLNLINIQNSVESDIRNDLDLKFRIQELKLYSKEQFFTEALEILILVFKKKKSARLLSKFIAFQLQIMKRHNSFLTFFKRALFIFSKLKNSNIFGVKIVISGRFNGVPRAKSRVIQVGRLPLQSIDSKVNYHSTEAHTPYGTFGIKVWICEK
jgi:small subunit ribosomal protein S3